MHSESIQKIPLPRAEMSTYSHVVDTVRYIMITKLLARAVFASKLSTAMVLASHPIFPKFYGFGIAAVPYACGIWYIVISSYGVRIIPLGGHMADSHPVAICAVTYRK